MRGGEMKSKNENGRLCLGVDLGGTNIKLALVTAQGAVVEKTSVPTQAEGGPGHVLKRISDHGLALIARAPDPKAVACAGIGSPGPLNSAEGIIYEAPNLGWKNVEARRILREQMSLPVALNNDANCAAWGEYWAGSGRHSRTMLCLTLGTGIGGGVVINGQLFKGACDAAGEFGHVTIDYDSPLPYYMNRGCLEDYASATGLSRFARMAIEKGERTALRLDPKDASRPTARDIYEAAQAGDELAARLLRDCGTWLGVGVANLINAFNPDRIVFTGGMVAAWDRLAGPLMAEVKTRAFPKSVEACTICPGSLWEDAGVIGAAGLGMIEMEKATA